MFVHFKSVQQELYYTLCTKNVAYLTKFTISDFVHKLNLFENLKTVS